MKKMIKLNKKGFTLVELLVVLVLLVVIMSIAIPSITSSLERSKQKQYDSKMEMILSAVDIYADSHKNSLNSGSMITIIDLINEGFISKEQAKNPLNESRTICGYYDCYNNSCTDGQWQDVCDNLGAKLYLEF